jgi:polysaccharide deacetylase family protein (PEP-CTERM system associated)
VNALSFDIEDWFHIVEIDAVADKTKWAEFPSLVARYTRLILDIIGEHRTQATFFMLGWVADRHPELAKMIVAEGHEIGTHSYWHGRVDQHTPRAFYEDMKRSIDVLEQQTGRKVLGFRAPSFSITPGAEWAIDVLHDLGLVYDASLFPAPRGHGGYPCPQPPHDFTGAPSGRPIRELPMSVLRWGKLKLPFSGGGYLRLLPLPLIHYGFHRFNREGLPVVIYLHPRDFAPDCPRVEMPLHRRFKCYVGTKSTAGKLHALLGRYRFDTCASVLGIAGQPHP